MAMPTLEHERGDDRDPEVQSQRQSEQVERLHEMTDHDFRGYVSDSPEAGIGDVVPYQTRQPNSPFVLGGMAMRRSFMQPGKMPELLRSSEPPEEENRGRDPSIMAQPVNIPPENYIG